MAHNLIVIILAAVLFPGAPAQFVQQGSKLVGSGAVNSSGAVSQGQSVAISSDGSTAIVGGIFDAGGVGAAWVFVRSNGAWSQQGNKLLGIGAVGASLQGRSVALSADGNTAIVGGDGDSGGMGAAWVYTRFNGSWFQQGPKLVGSGAVSSSALGVGQGWSVALSADGNTAILGGPNDNNFVGAAWVFTRNGNGVWTQSGSKLTGSGVLGSSGALQGESVALSGDGNTAIVGAPFDNNLAGALWVFVRNGGVWTQQTKITALGANGAAQLGLSAALSGDGSTAIAGGYFDNAGAGAAWVFQRSSGFWLQQGLKLTPSDAVNPAQFGRGVALASDGNTALVGGAFDNGSVGAGWAFTRSNGAWTQKGSKFVGAGAAGKSQQGWSAALSADAGTAILGAFADNANLGAAWVFTQGPHFTITAPATASPGVPVSFTVTAVDSNNNTLTGYAGTVHFTSSDRAASLPSNATLNSGVAAFLATFSTPGNQTITATDTVNASLTGTSGTIAVTAATSPVGTSPGQGSGSNQSMTFTFTDPRGFQDLDVVNVLINNFLDGRNACYLAYSRPQNVLYLVNDAGSALLPGLVLNGSGSLSNSQCAVSGAGSSGVGSGNNLVLTLNLAFAAFSGNKVTYLAARDLQGGNSGWQALGTWNVPGAATFPTVGGLTPGRGTGSSAAFSVTFIDARGSQDLGVVNILINNFLDGRNACYLAYSRPLNVLYLVTDSGAGLLPGLPLNGSGSVSNGQCTVTGAGSSASTSGNTLTLTLNLSFGGGFAGNRVIYAAARDANDANTSGWQAMGSWTVQ